MPVLPVTWMAPRTPSRRRLAAFRAVGVSSSSAVDADAEVFLGPWISSVVTAQSRFDMRDGNARQCGAEGTAECAGSVALHDGQGRIADGCADRARDEPGVGERIGLSAAAELGRGECRHSVVGRAEMRVLAGQHEVRPDTRMEERFS